VNLVTLIQEEFGEVGAVLAGDTSDERFFHDVNEARTLRQNA
jgi:hypothetical protein